LPIPTDQAREVACSDPERLPEEVARVHNAPALFTQRRGPLTTIHAR
jgi:hypothetical protein